MTGTPADTPPPSGPPGPAGPTGIDAFFERLRRLGVARVAHGKMAGGVCAGLARRWSVDPIVVRVAFAALMVFGGVGLLAYLVALALLPDERGTIFAEEALRRGDGSAIFLLVVIVLLLAGELSDRWWVWAALPLALATWWIVRGAATGKTPRQLGSEARGHAVDAAHTVRGWGAATPPAQPTFPPAQPTFPPATSPGPQSPPQPTFPAAPPPGPHTPPHLPPAAGSPWSNLPQDQPAPFAGPYAAPHGMGPGRTWSPASQPPTPLVVREKRRRGGLPVFLTTLGLAALTAGALILTNALGDRVAHPTLFAVIAGCAVAALVLFVVALRGLRAPFTTFLVTIALVASAAATFVPNPVSVLSGAGERTWTPVPQAALTAYALGFGEATLDLAAISPTADATSGTDVQEVTVQLGVGELVIIVPEGVTARINLAIGSGEVLAEQPGGTGSSTTLYSGGAGTEGYLIGTGSPDVIVNLSVGLGSVRLQSATAPSIIRDGAS